MRRFPLLDTVNDAVSYSVETIKRLWSVNINTFWFDECKRTDCESGQIAFVRLRSCVCTLGTNVCGPPNFACVLGTNVCGLFARICAFFERLPMMNVCDTRSFVYGALYCREAVRPCVSCRLSFCGDLSNSSDDQTKIVFAFDRRCSICASLPL
ncbi:ORF93 [Alphabaculovirus altermyunipunctae]|jgi:hypothetical protein|uniref:ORF93 n=1 Tax=Mythimna unipuncta nucleopolyhedrovirus TaxID=447897 RepID=A0A346TPN0_9ABAC|nr:ORF93 [Mythimna unipuncta nucleopolyhedrovirus]AXU41540.1 ORF93 [Mythimna unipuncta nucleopolyhedrovirus]